MARIVFTTLGSWGDLFPMLVLAKRLGERGHATTVAATPAFRKMVEDEGVAFAPIGIELGLEEYAAHPEILDPGQNGLAGIRNLMRLFNEWWPHVFIDCHTSDGSIDALDMTYDTSHSNQRLFRPLLDTTRTMLGEVARKVERKHGYRSYWYGNFVREEDPSQGWQTYPALPRFGSHYRSPSHTLARAREVYETYYDIKYPGYERQAGRPLRVSPGQRSPSARLTTMLA